MKRCGLSQIPDRRTFDRRLKTISIDIKERISVMTCLFVCEKIIDPYIVAIDSTLLKAKGYVWHKSSMENGIYHVQVLILMQGGDSVILKDGYLVTNYI